VVFVKRFLIVFVLIVFSSQCILAQQGTKIKKSQIIENIGGKDYYLHFVKQGETLFEIAKAYELTVNDIFTTNPESADGISPGEILKIPVIVKTKKTPDHKDKETEYFFHIVKSKETLYGISRKYGIEINDIKNLNPQMGDYPREGETIKIPVRKDSEIPDESVWDGVIVKHIVKSGETLYGIARQYNVTIGEIYNANSGLTDQLKEGMKILIPNQAKID
jgi:LysM repeat protein